MFGFMMMSNGMQWALVKVRIMVTGGDWKRAYYDEPILI